jgi:hypothetical protein
MDYCGDMFIAGITPRGKTFGAVVLSRLNPSDTKRSLEDFGVEKNLEDESITYLTEGDVDIEPIISRQMLSLRYGGILVKPENGEGFYAVASLDTRGNLLFSNQRYCNGKAPRISMKLEPDDGAPVFYLTADCHGNIITVNTRKTLGTGYGIGLSTHKMIGDKPVPLFIDGGGIDEHIFTVPERTVLHRFDGGGSVMLPYPALTGENAGEIAEQLHHLLQSEIKIDALTVAILEDGLPDTAVLNIPEIDLPVSMEDYTTQAYLHV